MDSIDKIKIHNKSHISDCCIITLDRHHHANGNLTAINNGVELPFDLQRTFSGSFDVTVDDGTEKRTFTLNRPYQGLLVVPGIWRTLQNFSSGSVCLALASHHFDENDYVREYEDFLNLKLNKKDE